MRYELITMRSLKIKNNEKYNYTTCPNHYYLLWK